MPARCAETDSTAPAPSGIPSIEERYDELRGRLARSFAAAGWANEADDLAAETLARCWTIEQKHHKSLANSYVWMAGHSCLIDHIRATRRNGGPNPLRLDGENSDQYEPEAPPQEDPEWSERVNGLLDALTDRQADVLLLSAAGWNYQDLAPRYGAHPEGAKKLVFRARRRLCRLGLRPWPDEREARR